LGSHIGDASGDIAEMTSKFLCGDGGGAAPVYNQTVDKELPRYPEEDECQEENSPECQELMRFMAKAEPREVSGACQEDCGYDGPYELMARRARIDCMPMPPLMHENYAWQERTVVADYEYNGVAWLETRRSPGPLFLKGEDGKKETKEDDDGSPCGPGGSVNDSEWNLDSGFRGDDEPRPLCAEVPEELLQSAEQGAKKTVEFREVVRVFSCTVRDTRQIELASSDQAIGGSGSESRSPHKVEDDIELGAEPFQIRAVAFGSKPDPGAAKQGVALVHRGEGTWQDHWEAARPGGDELTENFIDLASNVSRVSVAQAEFYFDGAAEREDWMWEMKWTARLRHFHLPQPEEEEETDERNQGAASRVSRFGGIEPGAASASACEAAGGDACESSVQAISLLDRIVRH
jgi:hypothetical protein